MNPDEPVPAEPTQTLAVPQPASDLSVRSLDALAQNQGSELFVTLFAQSGLGKALLDGAGRLLTVNQALCSLMGQACEGLCGQALSDFLSPADRPQVDTALAQLAAGLLTSYQSEKSLCHKAGQLLPVRLHLVRLSDPAGSPDCLLLELQDISREVAEETGWRAEHERLRRAETLANVYYSSMDSVTYKAYWSPEMYELFGQDESFVPGFETTHLMFEAREAERMAVAVRQVMSDYQPASMTLRPSRPDGARRIVRCAWEMLRGGPGRSDTLICYLMDITPFVERIERLQQANQALSAQNIQLKTLSELVDDSLTAPLSDIQAVSEAASLGELGAEAQRSLDALREISQELHDLRSLESERLPVSLEMVCQRVMQMLEHELSEKQVFFHLDVSAWNFIELLPFYLDTLLYHLLRGSVLLPAEGRLTIRLKSAYEADGCQILDYDVKGADLAAAFADAESELAQLKTLIDSKGGRLQFRQLPAGGSGLRIRL